MEHNKKVVNFRGLQLTKTSSHLADHFCAESHPGERPLAGRHDPTGTQIKAGQAGRVTPESMLMKQQSDQELYVEKRRNAPPPPPHGSNQGPPSRAPPMKLAPTQRKVHAQSPTARDHLHDRSCSGDASQTTTECAAPCNACTRGIDYIKTP
ncbi:hypothetical protein ECG_00878 [Echinococcus granulosus]|nr:hypothetical protein ECG_00878 [Echinococcus granulosus]